MKVFSFNLQIQVSLYNFLSHSNISMFANFSPQMKQYYLLLLLMCFFSKKEYLGMADKELQDSDEHDWKFSLPA
jgi:hypothetical protein